MSAMDAASNQRARPGRGEQTRAAIVDAALSLFEEVGYESATMRAIAERAGVSVGNAYYYFGSKEHLIQGFYDRVAEQHGDASEARLAGVSGLAERLYGHLDVWFELMERYHPFAAAFFRTAADPASPMSPFAADSAGARDAAIARFHDVVAGSTTSCPDPFAADLPELLWLYHMGLILFWVHDRTPGQVATRLALARTVPLVVRAIGLVDAPELRGLIDDISKLLAELRSLRG